MKKTIYIFLISLFLISCSEVIDIKVDEKDKKIVLNSIINPDSLIIVHLSKSIGILEIDKDIKLIENAEVQLFENNNFIENLSYDKDGYYYSTIFPKINNTYTLKVSNNELKNVESETKIPAKVNIKNFSYIIDTTLTINSYYDQYFDTTYIDTFFNVEKFQIKVNFDDPIETKNYYMITFGLKKYVSEYLPPDYTQYYEGEIMLPLWYSVANFDYSTQYNFDNFSGYVISDEFFNGKTYTLTADIDGYNLVDYDEFGNNILTKNPINIYLISISEEMYNYSISKNKYDQADNNPLSEPVNVLSNIKNGFGIFTSYSLTKDSLFIN